jgi:hypothetical protein
VAGEAEQVPTVMHELVHVAVEHSGSPLLYTNKVDAEKEQQPAAAGM